MTSLPHLHEPGVLHNLAVRYTDGSIYTWTGGILIALNPFAPIPKWVLRGAGGRGEGEQGKGRGVHQPAPLGQRLVTTRRCKPYQLSDMPSRCELA